MCLFMETGSESGNVVASIEEHEGWRMKDEGWSTTVHMSGNNVIYDMWCSSMMCVTASWVLQLLEPSVCGEGLKALFFKWMREGFKCCHEAPCRSQWFRWILANAPWRELYGSGVCFASQYCKAQQYNKRTDQQGKCMFVSRLVSGLRLPLSLLWSSQLQFPPSIQARMVCECIMFIANQYFDSVNGWSPTLN